MAARSDTEQIVLDVIEAAAAEKPGAWVSRYLDRRYAGGLNSLHNLMDAEWRRRFPRRRNRPTYRNTEAALRRLVEAGLVERREGAHDDALYRKAEGKP